MLPVKDAKLEAIAREIESVALEQIPVGSGRARGDGTRDGWIEGLANTRLAQTFPETDSFNRLIEFPAIASAIGGLMRKRRADGIFQVMVNRLDPGGMLHRHRDGIPVEPAPERWHLPVFSNPMVEFEQENLDGPIHMSVGSWWGPIEYWTLHSMVNLGEFPRVHLLVDLLIP